MATAVKVRNDEGQGGGKSVVVAGFFEGIANWFRDKWVNSRRFLHEVRVETRQVTWPSLNDVRSTTGVVIVTVFFFGAYLFVVDYGFSHLVQQLLNWFKA